jgi:hypothetical protein
MKERRRFLRRLGGITALLAIGSAARTNNPDPSEISVGNDRELEGGFFHMVFFWLVDDTPGVKNKFLKEVRKYTGQIEEIRKVRIGPPAGTDRDVVDNSYSYSLVVVFDSKKEHDIYQEHPAHLKFIENASSLWKRVQVYDSVKES